LTFTLRYWSEGFGIYPQWCRWGFFSEATDAVAQLVEALLYKPEGRGFDFRWSY
jgi:hypothetical protein